MEKHRPKPKKLLRIANVPARKNQHASVKRVYEQERWEYICADKKCRFYGKSTVQGVCHTTPAEIAEDRRYDFVYKEAKEHVNFIKRHSKNKADYLAALESDLLCTWMNYGYTLDELVLLRGRVAVLEDKLAKKK